MTTIRSFLILFVAIFASLVAKSAADYADDIVAEMRAERSQVKVVNADGTFSDADPGEWQGYTLAPLYFLVNGCYCINESGKFVVWQ